MQSFFRTVRPAGQFRLNPLRIYRPVGTAARQTSPRLNLIIISRSAPFQAQCQTQSRTFQSSSCYKADSEEQQPEKSNEPASGPRPWGYAQLNHIGYDHGITHLDMPWRPSDLLHFERRAYVKYGPNYLERLSPKDKEAAMINRANLRGKGEQFERYLGPEWYSIIGEAKELRRKDGQNPDSLRAITLRNRRKALEAEGATKTGTTPLDEKLRNNEEERLSLLRSLREYYATGPGALQFFIAKVLESRPEYLASQVAAVDAGAATNAESAIAVANAAVQAIEKDKKRHQRKRYGANLKKKETLEKATGLTQTSNPPTDAPENLLGAADTPASAPENPPAGIDATTEAPEHPPVATSPPADAPESPPAATGAPGAEDATKSA